MVNLDSRFSSVVSFKFQPLCPRRKASGALWRRGCVGKYFGVQKSVLPLPEIKTLLPLCPTHSLVTIHTELSQLLLSSSRSCRYYTAVRTLQIVHGLPFDPPPCLTIWLLKLRLSDVTTVHFCHPGFCVWYVLCRFFVGPRESHGRPLRCAHYRELLWTLDVPTRLWRPTVVNCSLRTTSEIMIPFYWDVKLRGVSNAGVSGQRSVLVFKDHLAIAVLSTRVDEGNTYLRNVGMKLPIDAASYPRIAESST